MYYIYCTYCILIITYILYLFLPIVCVCNSLYVILTRRLNELHVLSLVSITADLRVP